MEEYMQNLVKDWLDECQNENNAKNSLMNLDIVEAMYNMIEDWKSNKELVNVTCQRLFGFYRTGNQELKILTLQFLPSLIFAYLSGTARGDKKDVSCIQTLLLGIYNLEAGEEAQQLKTHSFRVPNIAQPSVYHEPLGLAPTALTESALRRLDPANRITVKFGPHPHLQTFNAENRLQAIAALIRIYSQRLNSYSKHSLEESCLAFTRLVAQGFTPQSSNSPRIPVSSQLLVEVLRIVYSLIPLPNPTGTWHRLHSQPQSAQISMEDGELATRALQTQEAVHRRAEVELFPAALLVAAASKDTSKSSIRGVSSTSQLVTSTGSNNARAMWKSMITNASFRTKKLPDDITVTQEVEAEVGPTSAPTSIAQLSSITEEADEPTGKTFRLAELSSLMRKKEKSKPTDVTKLKAKPVKKSANGVADVNGSGASVTDNGSVVHIGSDWNNEEEAIEMELRRKSDEPNIVPPT